MEPNLLYYGDNLDVLRRHVKDQSVDLVYLDPPFKSNQDYNVIFSEHGTRPAAQIKAFKDTWQWDQVAAASFEDVIENGQGKVPDVMRAFRTFLGPTDMLAYLSMMAPRLVELRRVLKPTGSIYLHCDPAASHYLKMLMDAVFGPKQFRNEIVWHYSGWNKRLHDHFERRHDTLLFYGFGPDQVFNSYARPWASVEEYVKVRKQKIRLDEDGRRYVLSDAGAGKRVRRYLDEAMKSGAYVDNVWNIDKLNNSAKEKLGYPTQKPEALLDRVILASSKEGQVVLDPFCGCGTTVASAQRLNRRWIGIDITNLAITLIRHRLRDTYGDSIEKTYRVVGEPVSAEDAASLAAEDPYQFQWWALGLVGARPVDEKKGADQGIDGRFYFHDEPIGGKTKEIIFSVKAGHTGRQHVGELRGTIEREGAAIGVLISLQEPTQPMRTEAATAGFYHSDAWGKDYPRIQLVTVRGLLEGQTVAYPPGERRTFRKAARAPGRDATAGLFDADA